MKRMTESHFGKILPKEQKKKIGDSLRGIPKPTLQGGNNDRAKKYIVVEPDGTEHVEIGFRAICKKYGFSNDIKRCLKSGIPRQWGKYKGWLLKYG